MSKYWGIPVGEINITEIFEGSVGIRFITNGTTEAPPIDVDLFSSDLSKEFGRPLSLEYTQSSKEVPDLSDEPPPELIISNLPSTIDMGSSWGQWASGDEAHLLREWIVIPFDLNEAVGTFTETVTAFKRTWAGAATAKGTTLLEDMTVLLQKLLLPEQGEEAELNSQKVSAWLQGEFANEVMTDEQLGDLRSQLSGSSSAQGLMVGVVINMQTDANQRAQLHLLFQQI